MRIDINYAIFSDRSETSSVLPKLLFQAAGRPDQAGPNPSLVVVIVAILLLILLLAVDHDYRSQVIMIAAGSGIAPFRSFWQARLRQAEVGQAPFPL